ncbi:hypothetical protein VOLCADRAFT_91561 [Volvox carteri f. nagariensis]|uniref:Uncharacterized protein n=1 Tax=Volvox carteri f. nagariensis TaxID=3068 RepID=D8TXE3_VOLCA|nr:uncharacterized protein VOLCADRAFT_91561 [Volvox carteri f. nagariensis]EFJ47894.1 hypothetical protein VOLCADRAFT_91561 [Volvox carteri f. nagariensis]|eukprot:XP_002951000.1 hypothetical protein VOLCADRAFT_91561 [Volvox carteri f. nagariensis]
MALFGGLFRTSGKRAPRRGADESDSQSDASEQTALPRRQTIRDFFTQTQSPGAKKPSETKAWNVPPAPNQAGAASAVPKNLTMAPEPVSRQRVIPGWTDTVKVPTGVSNLQQQRALVAELRAKEKMTLANRATAGTSTGGSRKAVVGTDQTAKAQEALTDTDDASGAGAYADVQPGDTAVGIKDISERATPTTLKKQQQWQEEQRQEEQQQEQQHQRLLHHNLSFGSEAQSSGLLQSASSLTASPGSAVSTSPTTPGLQTEAQEADPAVDYDLLYKDVDEAYVVLDKQTGGFARVEDLYGPDPEYAGFQDEEGNVAYYVVVRKSMQLALQQKALQKQQQQQQAPVQPGPLWVLHDAPSAEEKAAVEAPSYGAVWGGKGDVVAVGGGLESGAAGVTSQGEVDQDDDFEDLLSLCLA